MLKSGRRRNAKSKVSGGSLVTCDKSSEKESHTDILRYLIREHDIKKEQLTDCCSLPEVSVPCPDDAALPCSTSLCSSPCKNLKDEGHLKQSPKIDDITTNDTADVKNNKSINNKAVKIVNVTDDVSKKKCKKQTHLRDSQLTDFFPVRRSNRKTLLNVMKEKQKIVEEAILSGVEEGFEVKEFPGKGRGVVTNKAFKRGDYVLEYYGDLIDYEEAKKRESVYAAKENTGCYMYYFKFLNKRYCIDATKESGRLGRLINHSKKGNLKTQPFFVQECPHLVLFACRDIQAGEELLYDYGDRSKASLESHPWLAL